MNLDLENKLYLKSYLLGDLNPDEQERLEQHLMIDSAAFEEISRIEDELIDEYLEGGLSRREKDRFENLFLAARERKQKLSFAKSLKRYVAANKPKESDAANWSNSWQGFWHHQNRTLKWALAASLLLLIGGGFWSTMQISKLQVAVNQEQIESSESQRQLRILQSANSQLATSLNLEQDRSSQLEQKVANLEKAQESGSSLLPKQMQPILLLASLAPGRSRSSDGNQAIRVTAETNLVQLDLKMEPLEYSRYQARLLREEGDEILTQTVSSMQGQFSGFYISTELLTRGDYILTLSGITDTGETEEIDDYYFRVIPQ